LSNEIETVYILENPEKNLVKFATSYQLRYDDIIKEVFGVACLNDVYMMIQYNKSFQESICKRNGTNDNKVSLDQIIRIASKNELNQLKEQLIHELELDQEIEPANEVSITCPFDSTIQLKEGIFKWDETNSCYNSVKKGA
jgi:hypothetical protein